MGGRGAQGGARVIGEEVGNAPAVGAGGGMGGGVGSAGPTGGHEGGVRSGRETESLEARGGLIDGCRLGETPGRSNIRFARDRQLGHPKQVRQTDGPGETSPSVSAKADWNKLAVAAPLAVRSEAEDSLHQFTDGVDTGLEESEASRLARWERVLC